MVDDAILIYASTLAADMRHVIPHDVHDPFLYIEVDGAPHVAIKSLEAARMRDVPGMTVFPLDELGFDDFRAAGQDPDLAELSTLVAACRRLGVTHAAVPPTFPSRWPTTCAPTGWRSAWTATCSCSAVA